MNDALSAALADRYRIERELGAGGMATVYLAHDVRHDRDVAVKVLHADLGAALGAERFLAEIKTTAKLQHPHILPLLDSGEVAGLLFYVMPVVDGETLRARLERERQLPLDDALRIATEIASALDYAHRHGVIHRDIKPENILLHDGRAVVADFGIALAVSAATGPRMTQTGLSLGTPQYMAPEQAMGERHIDARADVYALGAVVYEMLTGEPPFTGATVQAIVAKVLTERPMNPSAVRDTIPRHVEAALLKALAKLPADRFATAAQFGDALMRPETMSAAQSSTSLDMRGVAAPRGFRRHLSAAPAMWAACAALTAVAVVGWFRHTSDPPATTIAVPLAEIAGTRSTTVGSNPMVALSRDGTKLAFLGLDGGHSPRLLVRSLADPAASVTVASPTLATWPAFSPDGESIAFVAVGPQLIQIYQFASRTTRTVGRVTAFGGLTWTDDSTIVFSARGVLNRWRVGAREPQVLSEPPKGEGYAQGVAITPSLVVFRSNDAPYELSILDLQTKKVTKLGIQGASPSYVDPGIITYLKDGELWGVQFDPSKRGVGPAAVIATGTANTRVTAYAAARTGALVVARNNTAGELDLVLVDRAGKARPLVNERRAFRWPRFSPDGRRVAVTVTTPGRRLGGDLWTAAINSEPSTLARVTADSASNEASWDTDGQHLIFVRRVSAASGGMLHLERIAADGSGKPEMFRQGPNPIYESALTPDGRTLVWREDAGETSRDILSAPVDSPTVVHPVRKSAFDERGFALSPDGRWLVFTSNESGSDEVYLCRLEPNGAHWRVSRNGGSEPRWARNGEIFFRVGDSVFVTRAALGAEPKIDAPTLLFVGQHDVTTPFEPLWDVSPDGRQFVVTRAPDEQHLPFVLMLDWVAAWRKRAGR